jgi:hypothetical protein
MVLVIFTGVVFAVVVLALEGIVDPGDKAGDEAGCEARSGARSEAGVKLG